MMVFRRLYERRISQWSERDKIITPCPHTPTYSRDDTMKIAQRYLYRQKFKARVKSGEKNSRMTLARREQ